MFWWVKRFFIAFFCLWLSFALFEYYILSHYNESFHQFFWPQLYEGPFPENKFPCREEGKSDYSALVSAGYAHMKESRIVICGLARNCALSLERIERRIESTGTLFRDYRVVLFENDSDDETRTILKAWQKRNPKVLLLDCKIPDCKMGTLSAYAEGGCSPNRFQRMADFRNRYLSHVHKYYNKFDYMMVIDMDLKGPWSLDGFASSFAYPSWDGMFAYGLNKVPFCFGLLYGMYDLAAYVKFGDPMDLLVTDEVIAENYCKVNFKEYLFVKKGDPLLPVNSAFGGAGIYKMKSLRGCFYDGRTCEHVGLHQAMLEKGYGRFYINPSFILLSGQQGPPPSKF